MKKALYYLPPKRWAPIEQLKSLAWQVNQLIRHPAPDMKVVCRLVDRMGEVKALLVLALACLALSGCAGMIFSHKPYGLPAGRVINATPKSVATEWPRDRWYWCGPGNTDLCQGDYVHNVCAETVPPLGTAFTRARVIWDESRKCWRWESQ